MKVREIMTTEVRSVDPETKLDEVARVMRDEDLGAVPVLDGDELCGIITDRDIVIRCVAEEDDPTDCSAEDILSGHVRTIEPDVDVEEASRIMAEEQIRRLPVCENGRLVGMLSIGDLAVKQSDDEVSAIVLEEVSEGVKAAKAGQRGAHAPVHAPQNAAVHQGGRQKTLEQEGGRRGSAASSARGRAHAEPASDVIDESEIDRSTRGAAQGISHRSGAAEEERQMKVVPIRNGEKHPKAPKASGQPGQRRHKGGKKAS